MPREAYRQRMPASCGAACLMCAAIELGATRIAANPNWDPMLWAAPLALASNTQSEQRLYSVTGGGGGAVPTPASGYSMPSYLYEAAQMVGLDSSAFINAGSPIGLGLQLIYRNEITRARNVGMVVHRQAPRRPTANERLLRVVRNGPDSLFIPAIALHWIMERPDGSVMDPAGPEGGYGPGIGLDGNSFTGLVAMRQNQGISYIDTGIGVMLRPGDGMDVDAASMQRLFS